MSPRGRGERAPARPWRVARAHGRTPSLNRTHRVAAASPSQSNWRWASDTVLQLDPPFSILPFEMVAFELPPTSTTSLSPRFTARALVLPPFSTLRSPPERRIVNLVLPPF